MTGVDTTGATIGVHAEEQAIGGLRWHRRWPTRSTRRPGWTSRAPTPRRRASSTASSSAGRSRSTPIRSTAATRSPRSAARTPRGSGRRWTPTPRPPGTSTSARTTSRRSRRARRTPAARWSWRRSTSATRAGWPSSRTRRGRSSRPGRARGWAASRPTRRTRSAGPSSTPAASTRRCRSTRRCSAGRPGRARWATDQPPYTEFQLDGQSVAGAWEMNPMVPAEVPSYWQVYFDVDDVDAAFGKAKELGAREMRRAAGLPRRPVRDRGGPAGRELRPAQDAAALGRSTAQHDRPRAAEVARIGRLPRLVRVRAPHAAHYGERCTPPPSPPRS